MVYQVVQRHLESWLAEAPELDGGALPTYVERDFRRYLELRSPGAGFRPCARRKLWPRLPRRLLLQGTWDMPVL